VYDARLGARVAVTVLVVSLLGVLALASAVERTITRCRST